MAPVAKSVDAYINAAPEALRPKLEEMRAIICNAAPKAEECISYGMPYYRHQGALAGFALFKNHIGFFPGAIVADFKAELANFKTSKGTVRFPLDAPLPAALIGKLISAGLKRNAQMARNKAVKKN
ncbi:MAG: DUF1801 domain-containing protein [Alphaproteobacteria bacterium]|nr:DUF1801 domain-containing protein [Alphaproteobacteria bacterium]